MKYALGLFVVMLLLAIPLSALAARHAPAKAHQSATAAQDPAPNSQSMFTSELVDKVKRGVITIRAMSDSTDMGGIGLAETWSGSGFIFQGLPEERAAYALTNHHVGQETAILECELWDHSRYKAELLATEPGIDAALIKIVNIPPEAYEVNVMGDSDQVVIGEPGLAMGAPGAGEFVDANRSDPFASGVLHLTATIRVVTGKDASPEKLASWWQGWTGDLGYEVLTNLPFRFIVQTAINPGNSGGPLFNARGEVIGLNHAHAGHSAVVSQNENYAIPINFAKNFADQIINTGKYELPWFGMDIVFPPQITGTAILAGGRPLDDFFEKDYDPKVLHVYGVRRDSPAIRAVPAEEKDGIGLRDGDIVLEFDGQTFPTVTDLRLYIFSLPIGKEVPVLVRRGHQKKRYTMTVGVKRNYDSEFSL